jgi:hypothetical protein
MPMIVELLRGIRVWLQGMLRLLLCSSAGAVQLQLVLHTGKLCILSRVCITLHRTWRLWRYVYCSENSCDLLGHMQSERSAGEALDHGMLQAPHFSSK